MMSCSGSCRLKAEAGVMLAIKVGGMIIQRAMK